MTKGKPLNEAVEKDFYQSMGAYQLTFLPLKHFPKEQIAPSEDDKSFRQQLLRGYVNDQGAAMLGGVAGHAGLFGTANDVAKMMQLFLQKGYYGGVRYFSANAFDAFNKSYFISEAQSPVPWALDNLSFQGREVILVAVYRLRALVIQALQVPWLGQIPPLRPFMYSSPTVPFPLLITKN